MMNYAKADPSPETVANWRGEALAPGVLGSSMDDGGELIIGLIWAENPGSGDVGRYLDSLPRDRTVVFYSVHKTLAGMLLRRGFRWRTWRGSTPDSSDPCLVREAVR